MVDVSEPLLAPECGFSTELREFGVPVLLRRIEETDRNWLWDLCKSRYPANYDAYNADAWMRNVVLKNPQQYYATRSAHAFQITNLTCTPWRPADFKADIVFVCAEEGKVWETLALLRDSIQWARDRKAYEWRFETETEFDLGPIVHKLGCRMITPRYRMEL